MAASSGARPEDEIQQSLRELFDAAAAKSMAVINQDDAEPEMVRFLNAVKAHPEQRHSSSGYSLNPLVNHSI